MRYQVRQLTISAVAVLELELDGEAGSPSLTVDVSQAASVDQAAMHQAILVALAPYISAPLAKVAEPVWFDATAPVVG